MAPKLYAIHTSPPCRTVYLTAKALGVSLDLQIVDFIGGEHLKPEFLKINPQHTVPVLDDDGFIIWDSHAISAYLVGKYGKDDSLYPKDLKRRALVDQRLHFDCSVAFATLLNIAKPIRLRETKTISDEKKKDAAEAYSFLESFLAGNDWVVPGEGLTIADFSLIASITSLNFLVPIDPIKYPNIKGWIKRAQALPYYNANQEGLDEFCELFSKVMSTW